MKPKFQSLGLEPCFWKKSQSVASGVWTGIRFSNLKKFRTRCQAKFLTSAKFLTCYCFSVILLLRVRE